MVRVMNFGGLAPIVSEASPYLHFPKLMTLNIITPCHKICEEGAGN